MASRIKNNLRNNEAFK